MMQPIENLPKGSALLLTLHVTDAQLLNYLMQPLLIAKIQHGMAIDPDECRVDIYVLKKERKRALKVLRRATATVDYLALSKVHTLLYVSN